MGLQDGRKWMGKYERRAEVRFDFFAIADLPMWLKVVPSGGDGMSEQG